MRITFYNELVDTYFILIYYLVESSLFNILEILIRTYLLEYDEEIKD